MLRWFVGWFKIRFVFTDAHLIETVHFIDRIERDRLNDERLWKQAQDARLYIIRELARRGNTKFIVGYE